MAEELSAALNVELAEGLARAEPCSASGIWRQSSTAARWTLAALIAALSVAAALDSGIPAVRFVASLLAVVAAFTIPIVAGISIGMSLVRGGGRSLADLLGITVVAVGCGGFALFASANRADFWGSVPAGHVIGPTGTYGSLVLILFGMAIWLRHARINRGDT